MSVLIKNMEIPEHCGYCRFRYDGICHALQKTQYSVEECPLVSVNDINVAPSIEPQQWIPISSNPITTGLYLVLCNEWGKNRYRICAYYSEVGKWIENGKNITKSITHWMPLPEPWKGGKEE